VIGKTISHYQILEKIGQGGMGVVYKARDNKLERTVALKFLPARAIGIESDNSRFVQEARAAASLHHPNICTIHEIDEYEGHLFIVMGFVEGENLQERISNRPLAVTEALDIVIQIASGLQAAHDQGIVHRDIKPANVMLDPSGRALLMDFGLARRLEATRLTQTGSTLGTFAYMSPEQLRGSDPDASSDIWSLGALLFEAVTGRPAFTGDMEPALMYAILNSNPGPVTSHRPEAPAGLNRVIARALEKDPGDRYQDAVSLMKDLQALRGDPEAFPVGRPDWRKRVPWRPLLTGMLLLTLAGAATSFLIPRLGRGSREIRSLAILPVSNLSGDPGQDVYADGIHAELIASLGKIDNLVVLGRREVLKYAGSDMSSREIALELGVDALMEGSVSFPGDRMQIAAELVQGATGQILWSDSFDAKMSDALIIKQTIALAVAKGINARLSPEIRQQQSGRVEPAAYRLYLKFLANKFSGDALSTLEKVVAIDSTYAEAWGMLSWRASWAAQYGHLPRDDGYELARTAGETCLGLDPSLSVAHMAMATVFWQQDWDWEEARIATERAAALDPMGGFVRHGQAQILFSIGKVEEAIALYENLIELYPLNPDLRQRLGWHLLNIGSFDLAVDQFEKNLELFPDHFWSNMLLNSSYAAKGEYGKAVALQKNCEQKFENLRSDADGDGVKEKGKGPRYSRGGWSELLATAYAKTEFRTEVAALAEESLANFKDDPSGDNAWLVAFYLIPLGETEDAAQWLDVSAKAFQADIGADSPRAAENVYRQAYLYAAAGDRESAYEWLELAFDLRSPGLVDIYRRIVRFSGMWGDSRFEDLMRRRGFPDEVIENLRP
jgi:serine/threonine protein kinase/tetratricopeptide (TPR) repeat protein